MPEFWAVPKMRCLQSKAEFFRYLWILFDWVCGTSLSLLKHSQLWLKETPACALLLMCICWPSTGMLWLQGQIRGKGCKQESGRLAQSHNKIVQKASVGVGPGGGGVKETRMPWQGSKNTGMEELEGTGERSLSGDSDWCPLEGWGLCRGTDRPEGCWRGWRK